MHVPFACHPPTYFTINSRSMQRWWYRDSHMQLLLTFPAKVTWNDLAGQRNNRGHSYTSGFLGWRCVGKRTRKRTRCGNLGGMAQRDKSQSTESQESGHSATAKAIGFTVFQRLKCIQCSGVHYVTQKQTPEKH